MDKDDWEAIEKAIAVGVVAGIQAAMAPPRAALTPEELLVVGASVAAAVRRDVAHAKAQSAWKRSNSGNPR